MRRLILIVCLLTMTGLSPVRAVTPDEVLSDSALEARARAISKELRCLVCQNQSIDDSDAELAHDLRVVVRERLRAGDSDRQVMTFVVERYGDYVRLRPPFRANTLALWLTPLVLLLMGSALALAVVRRGRTRPGAGPLTEDERARLGAALARLRAGPAPPTARGERDGPP